MKNTKSRVRPQYDVLGLSSAKDNMIGSHLRKSSDHRRSIINSNHTIRFAKETRFFANLEDKKNPYASYQDPGTMDFK